jgi:hypothetical protein
MDGTGTPVVTADIAPATPAMSTTSAEVGLPVAGAEAGSSRLGAVWWALRVSVVPWAVARVAVGVALAVDRQLATGDHVSASAAARINEGLLGWDAGWYESITRHGYWGAGHTSLRFFPLFPLLARGLSLLPGIGVGAAVVVVANVCALVGAALLVALVRWETGDEALAGRAAWLVCLAPVAFIFVMGYAEGTLLALSVGTFLALRSRHWWWAALLGVAAGLTRPVGVLLLVPALIEAGRELRSSGPRERLARAAAVAGPAVGMGGFLGWVGWRYGDALTPLRLQVNPHLHGHIVDPLVTLAHDASFLVHGHHLSEALHLPWALFAVALVVVAFRSWPASYGAFAVAVLAVALTGSNLDSFERYALSAFPLVLAGASLTADDRVFRIVLVLSAIALVGYSVLAFANIYVP